MDVSVLFIETVKFSFQYDNCLCWLFYFQNISYIPIQSWAAEILK